MAMSISPGTLCPVPAEAAPEPGRAVACGRGGALQKHAPRELGARGHAVLAVVAGLLFLLPGGALMVLFLHRAHKHYLAGESRAMARWLSAAAATGVVSIAGSALAFVGVL